MSVADWLTMMNAASARDNSEQALDAAKSMDKKLELLQEAVNELRKSVAVLEGNMQMRERSDD